MKDQQHSQNMRKNSYETLPIVEENGHTNGSINSFRQVQISIQKPFVSFDHPRFPSVLHITSLLFALSLFIYLASELANAGKSSNPEGNKEKVDLFPKIMWVVCSRYFQGMKMFESVNIKHQKQMAQKSGFEVRIVNSVNAYQWLSPQITEMIRKAKHNSPFAIQVADLLRIALLVEHGGISLDPERHLFLMQDLNWVAQLMEYDSETKEKMVAEGVLSCSGGAYPSAVLFEKKVQHGRQIEDFILIAKKNSPLFRQVFEEMIQLLLTVQTELPYDYFKFKYFETYNELQRAIYMNKLFVHLVTFRRAFWESGPEFCSNNKVTLINRGQGSYMRSYTYWFKIRRDFTDPREQYIRENGPTKVIDTDFRALSDNFQSVLFRQTINADSKSLFNELIQVKENSWLLTPPTTTRSVSFCIISLKPLNLDDYSNKVAASVQKLSKQCITDWKAVYFVKGLPQKFETISDKPKVVAVNASEWQGLNLQRAATQHCGLKDIALLLDYDESFEDIESLQKISEKMKRRDVYGVFLSAKVGEAIYSPDPSTVFYRKAIKEPATAALNEIINNFRVFTIEGYRIMPSFELHNWQGRYYNREIVLNTLILFASYEDKCQKTLLKYQLREVEEKVDIPKIREYMSQVVILTNKIKTFDPLLSQYRAKHIVITSCQSMFQYEWRMKRHFNDFFVYNDGAEFEGLQNRKHLPQRIPKKIHQIWVGDAPLPPHKKLLMDNVKNLHPDYEYYLWTNANLTRENFPATYELTQTLKKFDKVARTSKMAAIADIIRLEMIYRHGGVYIDTNYYVFRKNSLDDWLTYRAVVSGQQIMQYKYIRQNSFFAFEKGYYKLANLLSAPLLNSRNFFSIQAVTETGPTFLIQEFTGEAELDPELYQPAHEEIFPWFNYNDITNLCEAPQDTPDELLLFKRNHAYWKNCSSSYPWAFGLDFYGEGGSWLTQRP